MLGDDSSVNGGAAGQCWGIGTPGAAGPLGYRAPWGIGTPGVAGPLGYMPPWGIGTPGVGPAQKQGGELWTGDGVASWAVVASDTVQRRQLGAVWDMRFNGSVVHMGSAAVVDAIGGAIMGLDNFVVTRVGQGMVHYNYDEPWPCHFVGSQRGNTVEGKAGIRRAWLRRELRGLVLRTTGEVVVRGLHKFFSIGQLGEVRLRSLQGKRICEVTDKLDGQMLMGVVLGTEVRMWSRKGAIRDTAVGRTAGRVADAGHRALVRHVVGTGCTPVFELVGPQSLIRADEGKEPRLVLVAVRRHGDGGYWDHEYMAPVAKSFGVEVVVRHLQLEGLDLKDIVTQVKGWKNREGVVVRFADGTMVKVKSRWWVQSGFDREVRGAAEEWRRAETARRIKMEGRLQTREQRMAILGMRGKVMASHLFQMMPRALVVEMVYGATGRLAVAIVSFADGGDRCRAEQVVNARGWRAEKAYSRRTRGAPGRRVEVFKVS